LRPGVLTIPQHSLTFLLFFALQESEKACTGPTASTLLGDPAPPLEQLQAPLSEDVEAVERQRGRLQADWKLLQTTGESTAAAFQHST